MLEAIPELFAAGFGVVEAGRGVGITRGTQLRGRWIASVTGFSWYPAGAENATRKARTEQEAVYETLRMVLTSLQVTRRRPVAMPPPDFSAPPADAAPQRALKLGS